MLHPSVTRTQAVLRACSRWQNALVDTSGRNRLRRFRDLRTGTLDLTPGRAEGLDGRVLDRLLAGRPINLSSLFPATSGSSDDISAFNDARRRLAAIHRMALTNSEEKGIETLFAAIGLATWKVETGTPPNAPVVLLPLHVEATGAAARDFRLEVAGDAHLNPVLTHILRAEHDIGTDDDEADVAEDPPASLNGFRAPARAAAGVLEGASRTGHRAPRCCSHLLVLHDASGKRPRAERSVVRGKRHSRRNRR